MDKFKNRYDNSMHGGACRTRKSLDIQLHLQTMRLSDKMHIMNYYCGDDRWGPNNDTKISDGAPQVNLVAAHFSNSILVPHLHQATVYATLVWVLDPFFVHQ